MVLATSQIFRRSSLATLIICSRSSVGTPCCTKVFWKISTGTQPAPEAKCRNVELSKSRGYPEMFFFYGENEDSPLEYIGICDSPFSDKPICKTMSQIVTATFDASNFKPNIGPVEKKFRHRGSRPFKPRVGFQPVRGGSLCPPMLLT